MKRYFITGASRGIGRAVAERLAAPDVTLVLQGRDRVALQEVCEAVAGKGAKPLPCVHELTEHDAVVALAGEAGSQPVDALINNAGVAVVKPFETLSIEEWERSFAVNVTAPFLLTQKLAPQMRPGSSIVNVLSIAAKTGFPGWSSYCMCKFALEGFSQSVREELRPSGIRVVNIYPAATNTEIWDGVQGDWPRAQMMPATEIADAVAYALSRPADVSVENITLSNLAGRL